MNFQHFLCFFFATASWQYAFYEAAPQGVSDNFQRRIESGSDDTEARGRRRLPDLSAIAAITRRNHHHHHQPRTHIARIPNFGLKKIFSTIRRSQKKHGRDPSHYKAVPNTGSSYTGRDRSGVNSIKHFPTNARQGLRVLLRRPHRPIRRPDITTRRRPRRSVDKENLMKLPTADVEALLKEIAKGTGYVEFRGQKMNMAQVSQLCCIFG